MAMVFPPDETVASDVGGRANQNFVLSKAGVRIFTAAITSASDALKANESHLNELDSGSGDGDCGTTIVRGITGTVE
jgi:hypothetical protein